MQRIFTYIVFIMQWLSIEAQQMTPENYYVSAFNEISDMLSGRGTLSIKRPFILPNGHITKVNWITKPIFAMR